MAAQSKAPRASLARRERKDYKESPALRACRELRVRSGRRACAVRGGSAGLEHQHL